MEVFFSRAENFNRMIRVRQRQRVHTIRQDQQVFFLHFTDIKYTTYGILNRPKGIKVVVNLGHEI